VARVARLHAGDRGALQRRDRARSSAHPPATCPRARTSTPTCARG
jgi:hypothetical protein